MAKYLINNSGTLTEVATPTTSAGAADSGKIVGLDATGRLDASVMPVGIGADTAAITASEALSAGDLVNVWSNAGAFAARKADASASGKEAHGFVLAAVASGAVATVYFEASDTAVTGQTPGVVYLSATTPGKTAAAAPTGTGQVVQRVGFAVSATSVNFQSQPPIVLA